MSDAPSLSCRDDRRRHEVRRRNLNGLDYVEVELFDRSGKPKEHPTLCVYALGRIPTDVRPENILIEGGRRIPAGDIVVLDVEAKQSDDPERDDSLCITLDRAGDFSPYTLSLVQTRTGSEGQRILDPYPEFDQRYYRVQFSFKVDCPSDLDCKVEPVCPPPERTEPDISYLAKDYASFRQLILDRLALIMPEWQERHVPDLGIALVELLAYAGDQLSYDQDAVATEAYLDTARQRVSVRRHVRLIDYPMHDGCNSRAWVCIKTDTPLPLDPNEVFFITGYNDALGVGGRTLSEEDLRQVAAERYEVFEPMTAASIELRPAHNEIHFYTWGDRQCCLPRGATAATLRDEWVQPEQPSPGPEQEEVKQGVTAPAHPPRRRALDDLRAGDILIFEEVLGARTGKPEDADRAHRYAARLTKVTRIEDHLYGVPVVEIEWAPEDALPFPLCISALGSAPKCELIADISVARGNVILVDHGRTVVERLPGAVPEEQSEAVCEAEGRPADITKIPGRFRPTLKAAPLTFHEPLPAAEAPASRRLEQDARRALPHVELSASDGTRWTAQRDLLGSTGDDRHFVAEVDDTGRACLRFGDGELGRQPDAGATFKATYRIGNGAAGNVGAEAIFHIVFRDRRSGASLRARNPLPARGGVDPEPLAEVKLLAPHAFRSRPERAITADDYARLAERTAADHFVGVERAAAALRWTGSWYEAQVAIDPAGRQTAGPEVANRIAGYLHRYRRMGHDLVVQQARYVPLDIQMHVCVLPHYLRGHVEAALLDVFSNRIMNDGRRGFFHPDNLSFGGGIFLSQLVAAAQAVSGVESVQVVKLERLYEGDNGEKANGVLPLSPTEIAQCDNDPNFPEHGRLRLVMGGGR
ncbi:putative baseplate assembly protein [Candidatus Binatia bacterium]|nr:putative baseplate assembly protein [Candidatus Binatia bacterium]